MRSNTFAVLLGAVCAMVGPTIVHAFTNDPFDQAVLSLLIAGSFVIAVLFGVRRQ
ncbi:hypothetical protein [Methylobacterium haplocladii]|uniref:Uncharacterized protein n=1 Tax=Methylobacterium haplocladii TaxID=1176176 RepID=A0A512IW15_9HYPH|nr:hypothetical protein [Methylobacterium haplocladii]GEP01892.1 hypothetical protein MHA02_42790 [Methylobacterium haplocladii]GJD85766.1 hypothetical protein HPGCJGGD_3658 [Methylobacterium haplocladii]